MLETNYISIQLKRRNKNKARLDYVPDSRVFLFYMGPARVQIREGLFSQELVYIFKTLPEIWNGYLFT